MTNIGRLILDLFSHLFNTSGSGKTRLILDGLCKNWGFYVSCRPKVIGPRGSSDFRVTTETISDMSGWNTKGEVGDENARLADRGFSMLLLARIYVLSRFLEAVPVKERLDNTRRRWVFLQIMPASFNGRADIFTVILQSLRSGDGSSVLKLAREFLQKCRDNTRLFGSTPLYLAADEAQEGLTIHKDLYRSTSGNHRRPVLHAFYRFLDGTELFSGFIIAGTGLSMTQLERSVGSISAARVGRPPVVFTDTVHFTGDESDMAQKNYILRYLGMLGDKSDRLLERILYWFHGRYLHLSQPSFLRY